MADENKQPEKVSISLQSISQNHMVALQRQFDLLAFNLVAAEKVTSEQYEAASNSTQIMPFRPAHLNVEHIQAYGLDLLIRSTLNDIIRLSASCMDQCFFLCTLLKKKQDIEDKPEETQKKVNQIQNEFVHASLDVKFEMLENDFGIICELEDTITNLGFAFHAITRNRGQLTEQEVDENGELVIDLKVLDPNKLPKDKPEKPLDAESVVRDEKKIFKVGDRLQFTAREMLSLLVTTASFFNGLFVSVDDFGQSLNPNNK